MIEALCTSITKNALAMNMTEWQKSNPGAWSCVAIQGEMVDCLSTKVDFPAEVESASAHYEKRFVSMRISFNFHTMTVRVSARVDSSYASGYKPLSEMSHVIRASHLNKLISGAFKKAVLRTMDPEQARLVEENVKYTVALPNNRFGREGTSFVADIVSEFSGFFGPDVAYVGMSTANDYVHLAKSSCVGFWKCDDMSTVDVSDMMSVVTDGRELDIGFIQENKSFKADMKMAMRISMAALGFKSI